MNAKLVLFGLHFSTNLIPVDNLFLSYLTDMCIYKLRMSSFFYLFFFFRTFLIKQYAWIMNSSASDLFCFSCDPSGIQRQEWFKYIYTTLTSPCTIQQMHYIWRKGGLKWYTLIALFILNNTECGYTLTA